MARSYARLWHNGIVASAHDNHLNIIGAGLAGSLLAILMARRGLRVTVYEKRGDPRLGPVDSGRSINLALAARGIRGLERAGVLDRVMPLTIPMRGRMVHEHDGKAELQMYGVRPEEVIYSVSRAMLNRVLIEAADEFENVEVLFGKQVSGLSDDATRVELFDPVTRQSFYPPKAPTIATDGAGSDVRKGLARLGVARVREELLEHDYKELTIPAVHGRHAMEPNALHIWPRGGFMLIALPNLDGSFTATLFLAKHGANSFEQLTSPADVQALFSNEFPSARALMPDLTREFFENRQGLIGTVYADRWHVGSDILLLGDAAHAIVPFHGQGMNCAFEDCVELDRLLEQSRDWSAVFARFERERKPNTDAIAAMALENYVEMRATVLDPDYQQKKKAAEAREKSDPSVIPRYSMVMFHPEISYAEAWRRGGGGH
jgi:kynurenine 3-monooxygenase